jgi:hypothetical protein
MSKKTEDTTQSENDAVSEQRIEALEQENQQLREQVESLESAVTQIVEAAEETPESVESTNDLEDTTEQTEQSDDSGLNISRRGALAGMATAGLLGAGATGSASAAPGDTLTFGNGFSGQASSNTGLTLVETSGSGFATGLTAEAQSSSGIGVRGEATSSSGTSVGVQGVASSPSGKALQGTNTSTTAPAVGLEGQTKSPSGVGLRGLAAETGTGESNAVVGLNNSSGSNSDDNHPSGVFGVANASANSSPAAEGTYGVRGKTSSSDAEAVGVFGEAPNGDAVGLKTPDDAEVGGDLRVQGTKNFVQTVDTASGPKDVVYTAVEAGKPRTECSGVATIENKRTEIKLPDHFSMVTSNEDDLVAMVTPYNTNSTLTVVERSTSHIVVESETESESDVEFGYLVKGTRSGFEDREIIQESSQTASPESPSMPDLEDK